MSPLSYDKQFIRDWLSNSDWDKDSPPPILPKDIIETKSSAVILHLFILSKKIILEYCLYLFEG